MIAPVVGSGDWPAWMARVAKRWVGSGMTKHKSYGSCRSYGSLDGCVVAFRTGAIGPLSSGLAAANRHHYVAAHSAGPDQACGAFHVGAGAGDRHRGGGEAVVGRGVAAAGPAQVSDDRVRADAGVRVAVRGGVRGDAGVLPGRARERGGGGAR